MIMLLPQIRRHLVSPQTSLQIARCYIAPPRKSFRSNLTPLDVFWNQKVPIGIKYGASLITIAVGIANLHFNTLVTVMPPVGVGAYFLYKRSLNRQYQREVEKIRPKSDEVVPSCTIKIKPYDETDVNNVLNGIDTEYDDFQAQLYKIVESAIKSKVFGSGISDLFLDSNNQFRLQLQSPENMVTATTEYRNENVKFIKIGIPFVDKNKRRLGIVEVYLMELPQFDPTTYKAKLRIIPYGYNQHHLDIDEFEHT